MDSIPSPASNSNSPPTTGNNNILNSNSTSSSIYSPLISPPPVIVVVEGIKSNELEELDQRFTRSRQPSNIQTELETVEGSKVTQTIPTSSMNSKSSIYVPNQPFKSINTKAHSHIPPTPSSASDSDSDSDLSSTSSSPAYTSIPSFVNNPDSYLPSDDPDSSSSDEDIPKPARPITYSRDGKIRPRPSYYYDSNYDPANSNNGNQKRKKRRGGYKGIPIFEPTEEDFMGTEGVEGGGFYEYVKRIEKYGMRSGVVKVIPPKSWIESLPSVSTPLRSIRLKEPISQHILGSQGLYRVTNVAKTRIWNPAQWKGLAEEEKWSGPNFAKESQMGERSERSTRGTSGRGSASTGGSSTAAAGDKKGKGKKVEPVVEVAEVEAEMEKDEAMEVDEKVEVEEEEKVEAETEANTDVSTPTIPTPSPRQSVSMDSATPVDLPSTITSATVADSSSSTTETLPTSKAQAIPQPSISTRSTSQSKTLSSSKKRATTKRPSNLQRAEPTELEWQEFMSTFDELPHGMKVKDYTIEMMREVERRYWRTLTFGEPPMYGADMAGSLFDRTTSAWNVAHLGDLLPRLAPKTCKIPGVVSPYLYFGMWRATFAWHVEDADLYSINYIHFGAPKFWYAVPQEMSAKFERTMEGLFPTDRSNCPQFLRHKSFLASPRVLASSGIVLNRVVQLPGEFILTYPKGYHSGFNLGFNCAESINFATEQWLPLGKVAKSCVCIGDSVNINVDAWLHHAALDEENEDAKNPTSELAISRRKRSLPVEEKSTPVAIDAPAIIAIASPVVVAEVGPPAKKRRKSKAVTNLIQQEALFEVLIPSVPSNSTSTSSPKVKSGRKTEAEVEGFVCALCPDRNEDGLVIIGEPGVDRSGLAAHRVCVMFTPATWIEVDPLDEKEIVRGLAGIEKARWKLKCYFCPEKHGTKVQCKKGKCPRAFHITCALRNDSGALVNATINSVSILEQAQPDLSDVASKPVEVIAETPTAENDGEIELTILCKQHNPDNQRLEKERKQNDLKDRINAIPIGSQITVKTIGGVFDVTFVAVLPEKDSISFTFATGAPGESKWKTIVFPDSPEVAKKKALAAAKSKEQDVYVYDNSRPTPMNRRTSSIASSATSNFTQLPQDVRAPQAAAGTSILPQGVPNRTLSQAPQYLPQYATRTAPPQIAQQIRSPHLQQAQQPYQPQQSQQSRQAYQTPSSSAYPPPSQYSQAQYSTLLQQEALQAQYTTSHHQQSQYQPPPPQRPPQQPQYQQQQQQQQQQSHQHHAVQQNQQHHQQHQQQHQIKSQQQQLRPIPFSQSQPQAWPHTLPQQSFDYSRTMQHQAHRHSIDSSGPSSAQIHYQSEQSQIRTSPQLQHQSQPQQSHQQPQMHQQGYSYPPVSSYQHLQNPSDAYGPPRRQSMQSHDAPGIPLRRSLGQAPTPPQYPTNYGSVSNQDYRRTE